MSSQECHIVFPTSLYLSPTSIQPLHHHSKTSLSPLLLHLQTPSRYRLSHPPASPSAPMISPFHCHARACATSLGAPPRRRHVACPHARAAAFVRVTACVLPPPRKNTLLEFHFGSFQSPPHYRWPPVTMRPSATSPALFFLCLLFSLSLSMT